MYFVVITHEQMFFFIYDRIYLLQLSTQLNCKISLKNVYTYLNLKFVQGVFKNFCGTILKYNVLCILCEILALLICKDN